MCIHYNKRRTKDTLHMHYTRLLNSLLFTSFFIIYISTISNILFGFPISIDGFPFFFFPFFLAIFGKVGALLLTRGGRLLKASLEWSLGNRGTVEGSFKGHFSDFCRYTRATDHLKLVGTTQNPSKWTNLECFCLLEAFKTMHENRWKTWNLRKSPKILDGDPAKMNEKSRFGHA